MESKNKHVRKCSNFTLTRGQQSRCLHLEVKSQVQQFSSRKISRILIESRRMAYKSYFQSDFTNQHESELQKLTEVSIKNIPFFSGMLFCVRCANIAN